MAATHPIEGQSVLAAGAKASVTLSHLSRLLERVQGQLVPRLDAYERDYERVAAADGVACFLVELGHWDAVRATLGLEAREADAIRRAHAAQLRRIGRRRGRAAEFEAALEIREAVVLTVPPVDPGESADRPGGGGGGVGRGRSGDAG